MIKCLALGFLLKMAGEAVDPFFSSHTTELRRIFWTNKAKNNESPVFALAVLIYNGYCAIFEGETGRYDEEST